MLIEAQDIIDLYGQLVELALPVTFIFGMCNIAVGVIFNAFMRGRLKFGGRV